MIAVGTTVVRALETVTDDDGVVHPGQGWTNLVDHARARRPRRRRPADRLARARGEPPADARGVRGPRAARALLRRRRGKRLPLARVRRPAPVGYADTPMLRPMRGLEERLRLALEGTETGFWEWFVDTDVVEWSDNMGPLYGLPRGYSADRRRRLPDGSCSPTIASRWASSSQAALEHGTPYEMDVRVVLPDKGLRWLHARARAIQADGRTERITGLLSDVTERRQREEAHAFLDAASQVLAALDGPGRDARGGRAARRSRARGLVLGPARRRPARGRRRPRRPREGPLGARAAGALPARPRRADRRARRDPLRPLRALPGDRPRAARGRRARRGADPARPRAADALGDGRPADRPRAHARRDHVRLGRVGPPVLDARARAGRGARPPRRARARPRAAVRARARDRGDAPARAAARRRCRSCRATSSSSATSRATRATTPAATGTTRSSSPTGASGS